MFQLGSSAGVPHVLRDRPEEALPLPRHRWLPGPVAPWRNPLPPAAVLASPALSAFRCGSGGVGSPAVCTLALVACDPIGDQEATGPMAP